jgi:hypothetical protein
MNRVLRAAVTCLLLVALPLQGYAAGSMLFCDAGAATSGTLDHDDPAPHDGDNAHHPDVVIVTVATDDPGAPNLHSVVHGKCSICSSYCSAAALPSAPIVATATTLHAAPFPDLEHANPGHGPARLERPPRPNLG